MRTWLDPLMWACCWFIWPLISQLQWEMMEPCVLWAVYTGDNEKTKISSRHHWALDRTPPSGPQIYAGVMSRTRVCRQLGVTVHSIKARHNEIPFYSLLLLWQMERAQSQRERAVNQTNRKGECVWANKTIWQSTVFMWCHIVCVVQCVCIFTCV